MISTTEIAAWFGALGSAGLWILEVYKYFSDKPRIKFRVGSGFEIIGETLEGKLINMAPNKEFWSVDVSNIGKRKITITQLSIERNDTKVISMLTKDYNGHIPTYTLEEGQNHSYTIPNDLINFGKVKQVAIMDATGRVFRKNIRRH